MNYRRIAVFTLLILVASLMPGLVLAGLLGWKPALFGAGLEEISATFQRIECVATCVTAGLTYAWFLWPVTRQLVAHTAAAFLAVEVIQSAAGLLLGDSITDAFVWRAVLMDATYALIGLALVCGWRAALKRVVARR